MSESDDLVAMANGRAMVPPLHSPFLSMGFHTFDGSCSVNAADDVPWGSDRVPGDTSCGSRREPQEVSSSIWTDDAASPHEVLTSKKQAKQLYMLRKFVHPCMLVSCVYNIYTSVCIYTYANAHIYVHAFVYIYIYIMYIFTLCIMYNTYV